MHEEGHSFQASLNNWLQEKRRQFKTKSQFPEEDAFITKSNNLCLLQTNGMYILCSERTKKNPLQ